MARTPTKTRAAKPARRAAPAKRVQRTKGRPKREDQKVGAEILVQRACELLRTHRPRDITIAAVARHAGVNPALIRYYFGDRSALMLAVARRLFLETEPMREPVTTPESAERAVRKAVRSLIQLHRQYPAFRELFFEDIMNSPSPAARKLFARSMADEIARARSILALLRGEEPGEAGEAGIEPALLHISLIGMSELYISAFKIIETSAGSKLDRDRVDDQFVEFVANMMLNGLRAGHA